MPVNSSECPACGSTFRPTGAGSAGPRCGRVPPGWYHSRDGKTKIGPIGTSELKELAARGQLAPTDLVRRAADREWRRAERVRGRDPRARITTVRAEAHPFYSRPGLAYLLRGDIPEQQLAVRAPSNSTRSTTRATSSASRGAGAPRSWSAAGSPRWNW